MMMIKLTMIYYDAKNAFFCLFFCPSCGSICCLSLFSHVWRLWGKQGQRRRTFGANIASEKTLPTKNHFQQKNHCQRENIASKKSLQTKNHCQQKKLLPTKTLPAKNISSKKTLPAKNIAGRKSLPANIEFSVWKNGLLAQNPWNMGEQKWPILPAMETHKKCKNAAKATFALQQSFCPTIFIEIVYRSPTKDKPCQPMSSFKNKLASSQIKLEKLLNICVLSKI